MTILEAESAARHGLAVDYSEYGPVPPPFQITALYPPGCRFLKDPQDGKPCDMITTEWYAQIEDLQPGYGFGYRAPVSKLVPWVGEVPE